MNILGDRLKELREENNLKANQLAKVMNIERSTLSNWENGNRFPKDAMILKIADYFNVSIDYLFGRTNNKNFEIYTTKINNTDNIKIIKNRIKTERLNANLNQPELAKIMNTTKQTISNWENGYRIPDIVTLNTLADLFNCTVDYLIGRTNNINHNIYTTKLDNPYMIEIAKGIKKEITQKELNELIKRFRDVGFDINKILDDIKENFKN